MSNRTAIRFAVAVAAMAGLSSCRVVQQQASEALDRDEPAAGSYSFEASCEALSVAVAGYPDGTTFFVYVDGQPPYHLDLAEASHTFPGHVVDYGITIIEADGSLVETPTLHNENTC